MTIEEKERLRPHFEKENASFLIRCMTNRFKGCVGCEYYSLCDEEKSEKNDRSKSKQDKKLSNSSLQERKPIIS